MAKSKEKNIALKLRQKGESIKVIARRLKVSKSSVSLWCRDIELTLSQIQKLNKRMRVGSYKGRMKGAQMQRERRLQKIKKFQLQGIKNIGKLSKRDIFISGIAMYWGEGTKKSRRVKMTNSDPEIIKFMMKWFRRVWNLKNDRFTLRVGINKIHKDRVEEVEEYWSEITSIPREQFGKTTLIKAKNKKNYKNFRIHYGTLTIEIRKSSEFHCQIMGLLAALAHSSVCVRVGE